MRDGRARRAVLRAFVDPASAPAKFGFAVIHDVWTWNIDVQEMQFMYNNLHLPNTQADVERIMHEQVGTDDAEDVDRRLEVLVKQQRDAAEAEIAMAVQRRRDAMRRAARARAGLPQVPNGHEGVAPDVVQRIEAEIEATVNAADVDIEVFKDPKTGKTTYRADAKLFKLTAAATTAAEEEEEEEEHKPVKPKRTGISAVARVVGLGARKPRWGGAG